jgi:hypothetical protein
VAAWALALWIASVVFGAVRVPDRPRKSLILLGLLLVLVHVVLELLGVTLGPTNRGQPR